MLAVGVIMISLGLLLLPFGLKEFKEELGLATDNPFLALWDSGYSGWLLYIALYLIVSGVAFSVLLIL